MLRLESVSSSYGGMLINRDVDLSVDPGEVVALIGRNGVGKTTLAKTVIGLQPVASGRITFEGRDITTTGAEARARLGIGYVPQGRGIFAKLSVEENLRTGRRVGRGDLSIERAFELFPILRERRNQNGSTLSGGQQQMLAIGRVLSGNPRMLILDEPSDGIQPSIVEEIGLLISRLNTEQGLTTFLIEQNIDLILACATRCLVMEKGAIVEEVDPRALQDPDVAAKYLAV